MLINFLKELRKRKKYMPYLREDALEIIEVLPYGFVGAGVGIIERRTSGRCNGFWVEFRLIGLN